MDHDSKGAAGWQLLYCQERAAHHLPVSPPVEVFGFAIQLVLFVYITGMFRLRDTGFCFKMVR